MADKTDKFKLMHYIESPSYEMELTSKYCETLLSQLFNQICSEISPVEFAVLDTVSCHKGLCQRDLAKMLLKDRANTGRVLDLLEKKGFVRRYNDTKNNRLVRRVEITSDGEALINDLTFRIQPLHHKLCKILSDEDLMILRASLKKVRDAISKLVDMQI